MNPMRPLPQQWEPSPQLSDSLTREFGHVLDVSMSLRRFRNHYCEGQTSRNWDAKFENWVLSDYQRASVDGKATDDLGTPLTQRRTSAHRGALRPGDDGYVDPAELLREAVERSVTEHSGQPTSTHQGWRTEKETP